MASHEDMRVLIADDESLASAKIRELVEVVGYTAVGEAFDGREAVSMTAALHPDVVLMDVHMPTLDGIEATRQILQQCPTPVVMLTAYHNDELIEKARDAGAGAYLLKPPNRQEMERTIAIATARFHDIMKLRRLNAQLQTEIAERRQLEKQLRQALQERETLVRETHHRVKNNFMAVYSLLALQAETSSDPRLRELLQESINRVKAVSELHERLYQADNIREIDFSEQLSSLATNIFYSSGTKRLGISLQVDRDKILLPSDKAMPCALVINELMTNALKYAFPEGRTGTIRVEAYERDGQVVIRVSDDGVGMPENVQFRQKETFGLHLTNLFAKQLRGTLELNRENGCSYTLSFPRT